MFEIHRPLPATPAEQANPEASPNPEPLPTLEATGRMLLLSSHPHSIISYKPWDAQTHPRGHGARLVWHRLACGLARANINIKPICLEIIPSGPGKITPAMGCVSIHPPGLMIPRVLLAKQREAYGSHTCIFLGRTLEWAFDVEAKPLHSVMVSQAHEQDSQRASEWYIRSLMNMPAPAGLIFSAVINSPSFL